MSDSRIDRNAFMKGLFETNTRGNRKVELS